MRRKTKLGIGIATLGVGILALSACTASFCSTNDKAHMLAAYDNGVCRFYNSDATDKPDTTYTLEIDGVSNVCFDYSLDYNNGGITKTIESAKNSGIEYRDQNCQYWAAMDLVLLKRAIALSGKTVSNADDANSLMNEYCYLKFASDGETNAVWDNWNAYFDVEARKDMVTYGNENKYGISYDIDKIPTSDFVKLYKSTLEATITNSRGCITTTTNQFGSFGWDSKSTVQIEGKDYGYGWSKGFFEGLLVYPIGALIDVMCTSFSGLGTGIDATSQGWAQLLTILLVTLIIRAFMFAVSFKSSMNNARMTELQPQIAKIQAKYPNANTSQSEKARMGEEMQKLYRKNKINPLSAFIVMIFQFPIFICVWGAFTGSAWLATGSFLGMNFSDSISTILFNGQNWVNGSAWTALVLFILMALAQVASMLVPQMMQKRRAAKVAKLGKNPAQTSQNRTMKIVTWVMMAMIIFMGFSLASAMGVYWFVGALISLAQALITQSIIEHKKNKGAR